MFFKFFLVGYFFLVLIYEVLNMIIFKDLFLFRNIILYKLGIKIDCFLWVMCLRFGK